MQLLIIMWGIVVSFEASIAMCIFRYYIRKEQEGDSGVLLELKQKPPPKE
jgi:hypothetical protein